MWQGAPKQSVCGRAAAGQALPRASRACSQPVPQQFGRCCVGAFCARPCILLQACPEDHHAGAHPAPRASDSGLRVHSQTQTRSQPPRTQTRGAVHTPLPTNPLMCRRARRKLVRTPFPFPHAQMVTASLLLFTATLPLMICAFIRAPLLAAFLSAITQARDHFFPVYFSRARCPPFCLWFSFVTLCLFTVPCNHDIDGYQHAPLAVTGTRADGGPRRAPTTAKTFWRHVSSAYVQYSDALRSALRERSPSGTYLVTLAPRLKGARWRLCRCSTGPRTRWRGSWRTPSTCGARRTTACPFRAYSGRSTRTFSPLRTPWCASRGQRRAVACARSAARRRRLLRA